MTNNTQALARYNRQFHNRSIRESRAGCAPT